MSQSKSRDDAVKMVASIISDPDRSDRYLRVADGEYYDNAGTAPGDYYTTPIGEYSTLMGLYAPDQVLIPRGYDDEEYESAEECAEALLQELDELDD